MISSGQCVLCSCDWVQTEAFNCCWRTFWSVFPLLQHLTAWCHVHDVILSMMPALSASCPKQGNSEQSSRVLDSMSEEWNFLVKSFKDLVQRLANIFYKGFAGHIGNWSPSSFMILKIVRKKKKAFSSSCANVEPRLHYFKGSCLPLPDIV